MNGKYQGAHEGHIMFEWRRTTKHSDHFGSHHRKIDKGKGGVEKQRRNLEAIYHVAIIYQSDHWKCSSVSEHLQLGKITKLGQSASQLGQT